MTDVVLQNNVVLQIMTAAPANANHRTDDSGDAYMLGSRLVMVDAVWGSVQVNATGLDAADATVKVEACDTGVDGDYLTKTTLGSVTLGAGTSVNLFSLNGVITEKFYRVKYTKGANTTGTLNVYIHGKTHGV